MAVWLAHGIGVKTIWREHALSANTVRSQIQTLLRKTYSERQSDLVRRVLDLGRMVWRYRFAIKSAAIHAVSAMAASSFSPESGGVCSPALFLEYEEILKRSEQLAASGLLAGDIDAILNELAGIIEPVTTHYQWRQQLRDPADEMVLEAAANAAAQAIVTYKLRYFGPAKLFGIALLNPEQTLQQFRISVQRSSKP